jgi:RNA polymerase sigma factor (TIGR02999 family)
MDEKSNANLSELISGAKTGGTAARNHVLREIYDDMHRIAVALMKHESNGHTLQPTALVNEAMIKIIVGEVVEQAPNRRYLFGAVTRAMRQVLVDHYRKRKSRSDNHKRVPLDEAVAFFEERNVNIETLDEALDRLATIDERQGLVVALRYFAGLSVAEVADALEVCVGTVERDWRFARAWLFDQLDGENR